MINFCANKSIQTNKQYFLILSIREFRLCFSLKLSVLATDLSQKMGGWVGSEKYSLCRELTNCVRDLRNWISHIFADYVPQHHCLFRRHSHHRHHHHLCCSRQCVFHGGLWDLGKSWHSTIPARLVRFCKTWK